MSGEKLPDDELGDINKRLAAGLKTCRDMVANYKSLIASEDVRPDEPNERTDPADQGSGADDEALESMAKGRRRC